MSEAPLNAVQAIVMAGGKGTRLLPYTAVLPKPLLPLGEKPVLEWLLHHLRRHGIINVVLAVNHLHHLIQSFFGDGTSFGMRIGYAVEQAPLGTSGPVASVLNLTAPNFLVLNGDLLTDLDMGLLAEFHHNRDADATIATALLKQHFEYGVLDIDEHDALRGYREKPCTEHMVSLGIYMLRRDAVRGLTGDGSYQDMPDLLQRMAASGRRVLAWRSDGLWLDIGRPADYARAQSLVETGHTQLKMLDPQTTGEPEYRVATAK